MKEKLLSLILILVLNSVIAQKIYSDKIYDAYVYDKMDDWKNVCDTMQLNTSKDANFIFCRINYEYGYIGWCLKNEKKEQARKYLKLLENDISIAEEKAYDKSLINSYKSAYYAFSAGLNVVMAPINAPKSNEYANLSIKQDSLNYFAYIQLANNYRFTPKIFGGSKVKAITYYKVASILFAKTYKNKRNWNYLWILTSILEVYIELDNDEKAKEYCDTILKLEPDYIYVKNILLELQN